MKTIKVYHYDAFSNIPNMGNPAGVVLDRKMVNKIINLSLYTLEIGGA